MLRSHQIPFCNTIIVFIIHYQWDSGTAETAVSASARCLKLSNSTSWFPQPAPHCGCWSRRTSQWMTHRMRFWVSVLLHRATMLDCELFCRSLSFCLEILTSGSVSDVNLENLMWKVIMKRSKVSFSFGYLKDIQIWSSHDFSGLQQGHRSHPVVWLWYHQ